MKRLFPCITVLLLCISMFAALASGVFAAETGAETKRPENAINNYSVTVYFTGNEGLALKAAPSMDADRYLMIPEGTELYLRQITGYWGNTSYAGYNGWVYLKYTKIQGDYPTIQPASGFITPVYYTVYDTEGEGLELRKTPSAEDSTFGAMPDGTVVKAEAVSGDWVYAQNNGHYGWCHTYFLRTSTQDEISRYEQMQTAKQKPEQDSAAQQNASNASPDANQSSRNSGPDSAHAGDLLDGMTIPEEDQGVVTGTCIAEYKGNRYILAGYGTELEPLPITPAKYSYICSFAFYHDKVYYCCKNGGTSEYRMALFEANLDGSGQKELYDPGTVDGGLNRFAILDGFLYFRETTWQNSQQLETWYRIDLANKTVTTTQDVPDAARAAVSQNNGYYEKNNRKFYSPNGSGIVMENADGSTKILAQPRTTFRLEGVTSADLPDDLYLYYSTFVDSDAYLYRIKLSTGETEYVDSHMAVGGGIYFNW